MSESFSLRPASSSVPGVASPPVEDGQFIAECPATWAYLTSTTWEDGSPRETATLILVVEEGRWKACLSDKANGRVGWISEWTLAALLKSLEAALRADKLDWRKAKAPPSRRGRY